MKTIEVEMEYVKSTKNTHVYNASYEKEVSPVPTIYIKRDSLVSRPDNIKVVISYDE